MSWIKTIPVDAATGHLRQLYHRVKGPSGAVDNILQVHSLRPASLVGHLTLYKNVLHHTELSLPLWYRETVGVYVSLLNRCSYCVDHHFQGLRKELQDEDRANAIRTALEEGELKTVFSGKERSGLHYTRCLATNPASLSETMIGLMREAGFEDAEILELNQIVAYFGYANRTVLGLGVTTEGDELGLAPRSGDGDWSHK